MHHLVKGYILLRRVTGKHSQMLQKLELVTRIKSSGGWCPDICVHLNLLRAVKTQKAGSPTAHPCPPWVQGEFCVSNMCHQLMLELLVWGSGATLREPSEAQVGARSPAQLPCPLRTWVLRPRLVSECPRPQAMRMTQAWAPNRKGRALEVEVAPSVPPPTLLTTTTPFPPPTAPGAKSQNLPSQPKVIF